MYHMAYDNPPPQDSKPLMAPFLPLGKKAACGHTHTTPDGLLVRCYHTCKSVLVSPAFWIGSTLSFPIEHALWTKMPFLKGIATWAGL